MRAVLSNAHWPWILALLLAAAGLAIRFAGLSFVSFDMEDFLIGWYDKLAAQGFAALRRPFSNYTPPYLYLLALAPLTQSFLPKVAAIKLISIFFDLCNAFLVYRILKIKYPQGWIALLGGASFLLLPTILLNSAYWGQADATYTCFMLACIYFLMKGRPLPAMICLGLSFSLKAQAAFIAPLLLLLIARKQMPWYYVGIVPVVYALMMIPAALTGRPFLELLTIYVNQAGKYGGLSMHGPNLYVFVSNDFYTPGVLIGAAVTAAVVLAWIVTYSRSIQEFTPGTILLCALVSVAILPFFLPKMHDRYFYLADVLSFLVAFYFPRIWFLAAGYQLVSGMAYSIFLIPSVVRIGPHRADLILKGSALASTLTIGLVLWSQWRLLGLKNQRESVAS
jgi:Gpi18-like mannosyltransferase